MPRDESLRHCGEERFPDNFLGNRKSRRKCPNKPGPHVIAINTKTTGGTHKIPRGQPIGNCPVEIEKRTRELALCGRHGCCSSRDTLGGAIKYRLSRHRFLPQNKPVGYIIVPFDKA